MGVIQLTGNYNFFNMLTAALALSCLDDKHFIKERGEPLSKRKPPAPAHYTPIVTSRLFMFRIRHSAAVHARPATTAPHC